MKYICSVILLVLAISFFSIADTFQPPSLLRKGIVPSTSSSSGASTASDLSTYKWTGGGTSIITAACDETDPCNTRFDNTTYRNTDDVIIERTAGVTGTIFVWVNSSGTVIVGRTTGVTANLTGATDGGVVTDYPADGSRFIPIGRHTIVASVFASDGYADDRAFLSNNASYSPPSFGVNTANPAFWPFGFPAASFNHTTDLSGKRRYYPVKIYQTATFGKWCVPVQTPESDVGTVGLAVALYDTSGTRIDETMARWTTDLASAAGTRCTALAADYTIDAGEYILGWVTDSTTVRFTSPVSSMNAILSSNGDGTAATLAVFEGSEAMIGSGSAGTIAMPTTIGIRTALTTATASHPPSFAPVR